MKLIATLLVIISLSKLSLVCNDKQVEVRRLVSNLPIHISLLDPITKSIIVLDGLVGLICSLIIFAL